MVLPARSADERAVKLRAAPVYPEIARRMKIGGAVRIEATADAQGKVTDVKTVSGNHMLTVATEDAVRQWRFAPASGDTTVSVEVNFSHQDPSLALREGRENLPSAPACLDPRPSGLAAGGGCEGQAIEVPPNSY